MQISNLFGTDDDDRAVSPVIGVILMVAITVILAAVIGTFVLGLGDQVQQTAPNSNFAFDYDSPNSDLEITHEGGDGVDHSQVEVIQSGNNSATLDWYEGDASITNATDEATVSAGDSFEFSEASVNVYDDDTVRAVWTSQSGDQSSTMARWEGPDA